jgi:hypothetical protein
MHSTKLGIRGRVEVTDGMRVMPIVAIGRRKKLREYKRTLLNLVRINKYAAVSLVLNAVKYASAF